MKHKEKFLKDVRFYIRNRHRFTFTGSEWIQFPFSRTGVDGLTAYKKWDSNGITVETRHPVIAQTLSRVKASVNFQIKEWKAGVKDRTLFGYEIISYLNEIEAPDWVLKAING